MPAQHELAAVEQHQLRVAADAMQPDHVSTLTAGDQGRQVVGGHAEGDRTQVRVLGQA